VNLLSLPERGSCHGDTTAIEGFGVLKMPFLGKLQKERPS